MPVDGKRGQTFLRMCGQYSSEINRAGAFGAVEAPYCFDGHRIHIHGFAAIAPAGCHRQCAADIFTAEFFRAACGFRAATDGGIRDHALYRRAVGVKQGFRD
ncbi:hypothetical protein SDC9_202840 [bioreactor metagenome]|uniref:Uncharacterized protein n=1 Tax=bioreactor metagenome TaxID=1076179 RepID=A0A645IUS0_9ZZZZ